VDKACVDGWEGVDKAFVESIQQDSMKALWASVDVHLCVLASGKGMGLMDSLVDSLVDIRSAMLYAVVEDTFPKVVLVAEERVVGVLGTLWLRQAKM
jgi:hypothetical protein